MGSDPSKSRKGAIARFSLATALLVLVAACASVSDIPAQDLYQPPPPGASAALLKGSNITETGLWGSDHRGYALMIDLKSIPDAADHWNEPVALSPGWHTIGAEYRYSNFIARAYLPFEAKAGTTYQLMIKPGLEDTPEARRYNDFWIVDLATGKPVTPVHHQQTTGGKTGTIFYNNK